MNQRQYIKEVARHLNCPTEKRKNICKDLDADICAELENGKTWDEIRERMGEPLNLAKEFNENLGEGKKKKSKKQTVGITAAIIVTILLLLAVAVKILIPQTVEIGTSGIFDEKTVNNASVNIIELVNHQEYERMLDEYSADILKKSVTGEDLADAAVQVGEPWGEFQKITSERVYEVHSIGTKYAVEEVVVLYENRSVTFTLSFDKDMMLAGIYMK